MISFTSKSTTLIKYFQSIYLDGLVPTVKIDITRNGMSTGFASEARDMVGFSTIDMKCQFDGIDVDKVTFGIAHLELLLKLLGTIDSSTDSEVVFVTKGDRVIRLQINCGTHRINFPLAEISIIKNTPSKQSLPDPDVTGILSQDFITSIQKAQSALSEEPFGIWYDDLVGKIYVAIGTPELTSNSIVLEYNDPDSNVTGIDFMRKTFSPECLKKIFNIVKHHNSIEFTLSSQGIFSIKSCSNDLINVNYHLIETL